MPCTVQLSSISHSLTLLPLFPQPPRAVSHLRILPPFISASSCSLHTFDTMLFGLASTHSKIDSSDLTGYLTASRSRTLQVTERRSVLFTPFTVTMYPRLLQSQSEGDSVYVSHLARDSPQLLICLLFEDTALPSHMRPSGHRLFISAFMIASKTARNDNLKMPLTVTMPEPISTGRNVGRLVTDAEHLSSVDIGSYDRLRGFSRSRSRSENPPYCHNRTAFTIASKVICDVIPRFRRRAILSYGWAFVVRNAIPFIARPSSRLLSLRRSSPHSRQKRHIHNDRHPVLVASFRHFHRDPGEPLVRLYMSW
ncbi:hypothetical protein CERSUDRAFT_117912 [Gelatoporia subvermispora B]|uniref:Uncharacterized protein n=1 Tax=Ceriporiopsis subvermispora (strain B) TaxID=914234 RepID=M2QM86_CERS8|nr:hypothetical protein CERSUDRAFT_117912 [Gelatoporia subvermispora B]